MFAQFETTVGLPALKDGFVFGEIDVRVTIKGDVEGVNEYGENEFDFVISHLEGHAIKSALETEYQEIEAGSYFHTILLGAIEQDASFNEQAAEALSEVLSGQKHAAE